MEAAVERGKSGTRKMQRESKVETKLQHSLRRVLIPTITHNVEKHEALLVL